MVQHADLIIRPLVAADARALSDGFAGQGWCKPESQFLAYLNEQQQGERQVFVAAWKGKPVGYVCLLPDAPGGLSKVRAFPASATLTC